MSYQRANLPVLQQAQADFSLAYRALVDELDDLEKQLETKLSQWEGQAVEAYWIHKREWDKAAAQIGSVLNQIGVVINDAHQNYTAAERHNSGVWGG